MAFKIIDVSHHQGGNIDFSKVKAAGYGAVMIRCGYANHPQHGTRKDNYWERNYAAAVAAGLPVGVYIFDYGITVNHAKACAQFLLDCIKGKKIEFPIAYDIEYEAIARDPKAPFTDMAIAACSMMEQAGYYTLLYTNPDFLQRIFNYDKVKRFDLWLANYRKPYDGSNRPTTYSHGIWQYAAVGTANDVTKGYAHAVGSVPGVNAACDLNWCYKDYVTVIKKLGLNHLTTAAKTFTVSATKSGLSQTEAATLETQLKSLGMTVTKEQQK